MAGNTKGAVAGQAGAGDSAKAANPAVAAETPQEKTGWARWGELTHTVLDVAGMIPVVGIFADGANAAIYTAEGNYVEAGISAASAAANFIPGGGIAAKGAKVAVKAGEKALLKAAEKELAERLAKEAAERALKEKAAKEATEAAAKKQSKEAAEAAAKKAAKEKAAKEAAEKKAKDAKVKPAVKKKKVKCFCVDDHAKGGRDEYKRQLDNQQKGINDKTVDQYLADRAGFEGKDPCSGAPTQAGKTTKRNGGNAQKAKDAWQKESTEKYAEKFRGKLGRADANRLGAAKAQRDRNNQHALHNSDMKAGGKDQFGKNGSLSDADFGDAGTNKHIGSQWKGDRIDSMDREACQAKKDGKGNEKMNLELRPCGKHEAKGAGCKQKKRK